MQIYVRKDSQEYGPYTLDELRYHVLTGNCSAHDLASHDGENWMTISQVPGLVSEYQPDEEETQTWQATDQRAETETTPPTEQPQSLPSAEAQTEGQQTPPVIARQLIFTSSPQGLEPGRSGYCTVARHKDLRSRLVRELERLSLYDFNHQGDGPKVDVATFRKLALGSEKFFVLSRIRDADLDYTNRTNYIAHHLILDNSEITTAPSPAEILSNWSGWLSKWEGPPRYLNESEEIDLATFKTPGLLPANGWLAATNDPGNAAILVSPAMKKPVVLEVHAGQEESLLKLFAESSALIKLSLDAWDYPFTTFLQENDDTRGFAWIGSRGQPAVERLKLSAPNYLDLRDFAQSNLKNPIDDDLANVARKDPKAKTEEANVQASVEIDTPTQQIPIQPVEDEIQAQQTSAQAAETATQPQIEQPHSLQSAEIQHQAHQIPIQPAEDEIQTPQTPAQASAETQPQEQQTPTRQSVQQQVQSGQRLKPRINKPRQRPGYRKQTVPPVPKDKKVLSVRDLMVIGGFVTLLVVAGYFAWQFTQEEEQEPAGPEVMAQVGSEPEIFELEPEPTLEEQAEAAALESLREIERQQEIERLAKLKEMQEEKEEQEPTNNEPQKEGPLTAGQIEGMFSEAVGLFHKGKHLEAKEKMAKAYAAFELLENKDNSTRIRYLRERCNLAFQLKENDDVIGFAKEIMVHAGNDEERLFVSNRLALAYAQKREFDQAIEHFERELSLSRKLRGPEHPAVANAYNNLAVSYNNQGGTHHNNGEYGKAIEHFEKSLAIKVKSNGPKHPDVISCKRNLSNSHHNLGNTFQGRGEQEKAIEHFEKSLALRQQIHGPEHIELSGSYSNLGVAYYEKGDHAKAIDYLEKSLAIKMKTLGPDHPQVKQTQNNLANVRAAAKR